MAILSGGPLLARLNKIDPQTGALVQKLFTGLNTLARNTTSSAAGPIAAPHPPTGLNVMAGTDGIHFSIEHPGQIQRGIRYFSEVSKTADFSQVVAINDHGASRTPAPTPLPALDGSGNAHTYYLRSYAQYAGSEPSPAYTYGGADSPTPITLTGASKMDFAPSTGSGTAANSGGQPGYGLGRFQTRSL